VTASSAPRLVAAPPLTRKLKPAALVWIWMSFQSVLNSAASIDRRPPSITDL
jgi:hypothetical protein